MTDEIKVTVADVRAVNFCARGARQWFTRHGLDYSKFVTEGLPISQIEATGDAMGKIVAAHARAAATGDGS